MNRTNAVLDAIYCGMPDQNLHISKILIQRLGFLEAAYIQVYMDASRANNDNWFTLTHVEVAMILNQKPFTVQRYKATLKRWGILKSKMGGMPYKEYLKFNYERLNIVANGG